MEPTREIGLGIASVVVAAISVAATVLAARAGEPWMHALILTLPLAVIGVLGAIESFQRAPRDGHGNRIRKGRP